MRKKIYLAAGCFWGAEHYLKQIQGITFTEVGFANGHTLNPSYQEVYTDTTGFAECVFVEYDPTLINLKTLIELYFQAIDPTLLNQQGEDKGTRYRTGIYYIDNNDLATIQSVFDTEQAKYDQPLCVEILPLQNYYKAEEYHQDYLEKNPSGYCHLPKSLFYYAKHFKQSDKK